MHREQRIPLGCFLPATTEPPTISSSISTTTATASSTPWTPRAATSPTIAIVARTFILHHGLWAPTAALFGQGVVGLAHLGVTKVHLSIEVIRQSSIVVEPRQIRSADVADLQLLVAGWTTGVAEILKLTLAFGLRLRGLAYTEELLIGPRHLAQLAQDLHLGQPAVDSGVEFRDGLEEHVGLADLVGGLLQPSLRGLDPAVALVDVLLQVPEVVVLEAVLLLRGLGERFVFCLQRLGVHLGTRADVLLGVREEVVRTGAYEERAADFLVGEGELGCAGRLRAAHELLFGAC